MQYLVPKKRLLPILFIGFFLASAISFYILSRPHPILIWLFPYVVAILTVAALFVFGRYLAFGILYWLGDDYTDLTFTVYRVYQTTSTPIFSLDFNGNERLILLNKSGKKTVKKKKRLGIFTANPVCPNRYALMYESGYILVELDAYAKAAIEERITRAKTIYTIDT